MRASARNRSTNSASVGVLGLEHLDRDAAAQAGVDAFPDLTHAAGGDQPLQPVAAGQRHSDARAHEPSRSAAAMVARPIGAATAPPVADKPVTTVLDQHGDRDLGGLSRRECDVPGMRRGVARIGAVLRSAGLRCDLHAGDGSLLLRHLLRGDHQIRQCICDLLGDTARRSSAGAVVLILARSGPFRLSTKYGRISTPLFAMVAATSRSAAVSARRPSARCSTCPGPQRRRSGRLSTRRPEAESTGAGCPDRTRARWTAARRQPVLMPSWTKAVLHDLANASRRDGRRAAAARDPP